MNKLKLGLFNIWSSVAIVCAAAISILLYLLNLKSKELDETKAKIALANTQKKADAVEAEIKQKLAEKELTKREIKDLNKALDLLEEKRQTLKQEGSLTDSEVENFWNKK